MDAKGKCLIYDERPVVCKHFPRVPADLLEFPRCTYSFDKEGVLQGECNPDCSDCCVGMTFDENGKWVLAGTTPITVPCRYVRK
jgi:hypothetical protein